MVVFKYNICRGSPLLLYCIAGYCTAVKEEKNNPAVSQFWQISVVHASVVTKRVAQVCGQGTVCIHANSLVTYSLDYCTCICTVKKNDLFPLNASPIVNMEEKDVSHICPLYTRPRSDCCRKW